MPITIVSDYIIFSCRRKYIIMDGLTKEDVTKKVLKNYLIVKSNVSTRKSTSVMSGVDSEKSVIKLGRTLDLLRV